MAINQIGQAGAFSALANGANSFMNSYLTANNLKHQQQMAELAAGVQKDEHGNLVPTPQRQQAMQLEGLKKQHEIGMYSPTSPETEHQKGLMSQFLPKGQKLPEGVTGADLEGTYGGLLKSQLAGEAGMNRAMVMAGPRIESVNQGVHQRAVDDVSDKNHNMAQLQTTYQNLGNAIQNFQRGGATPQEFHELQQAVRANAGVKGSGGVNERADTYLKSAGLNWDNLKQFLSEDPQSVMKNDPKLANVVLGIANLELQNKQKQALQETQTAEKKHKSFYKQHPDLASDFNSTKRSQLEKFGIDENGNPLPGGLLQAQPDLTPDVISYAKTHNITPEQALQIKKARGG